MVAKESSAKNCFVVAPIGDDDSDTRKRSDQVLKHVINPVVEPLGYTPLRADQLAEPGLITSQVIQHVADDPLVIADLTERNPNVFYELAIRHVLKKPLVQLIAKGERIPFDVAGMRTIEVDIKDLDNVEDAKTELDRQIKKVEADPGSLDTPVSFAFDLSELRQSGDPEERSLADLVTTIAELRSGLSNIEDRLRQPEALLPPEYIEYVLRHKGRGSGADEAVRHAEAQVRQVLKDQELDDADREKTLKDALAALRFARRELE